MFAMKFVKIPTKFKNKKLIFAWVERGNFKNRLFGTIHEGCFVLQEGAFMQVCIKKR
jgi:hypothetical protein